MQLPSGDPCYDPGWEVWLVLTKLFVNETRVQDAKQFAWGGGHFMSLSDWVR